jgi:hypothetical protein
MRNTSLADLTGLPPAVQALFQHREMKIQTLMTYKAQTKKDKAHVKGPSPSSFLPSCPVLTPVV